MWIYQTHVNNHLQSLALFTLGKTAILKIAVFCVTIYTCQKNREVRAGTKDRDFLIGTAHAPHVGKGMEVSKVTWKKSRFFCG